ncbi:MAG: hypothetical protein H7239_11665 [Flavobacterium sp.]|nr:hypothetical protein [Flavobacterium sp.]
MNWIKKGLIYVPNKDFDWQQDRAIAPVCDLISDNVLRIYFSSRDMKGRSTPIYLDTNPEFPEKIISICGNPILNFGPQGSFDDNGILSSSIVNNGNDKYLYYVGWNPRVNVSYHLSIGLAISKNGGDFEKYSDGPILDRSPKEPFFNTAPFVLKESEDDWKMWYVSCTGWKMINNYPEPLYNVKFAQSNDGINWKREAIVAIETDVFAEAVGKPFVFKEDGIYKMIYSYRNSVEYRTNPEKSYRLGYAESENGINWVRKDNLIGIKFSSDGWDSIMMEYASSYIFKGKRYLIYNGNGFGESGFGYAILE